MTMLKLSDLDRANPRYLSADQRRARDGLYPSDNLLAGFPSDVPRLRIARELSEAELAKGARLAREGASIRRIVRELHVTRGTAWGIYRQHRPDTKARPPRAVPAPTVEPAPVEPPTVEPAPAPEPPPVFDWAAERARVKAGR